MMLFPLASAERFPFGVVLQTSLPLADGAWLPLRAGRAGLISTVDSVLTEGPAGKSNYLRTGRTPGPIAADWARPSMAERMFVASYVTRP